MVKPCISSLHIYPVKGMRGISLDHAELTPEGLRHDRRWMVVRSDGRFVSQREEPRLALFETRLDEAGVGLALEGHGTVRIPLGAAGDETTSVRIWRDLCEARDEGPEVSRWLTMALASPEPLRLVRMATGFRRPQSQPERFGADTSTYFADAAPFLVTSEASLEALNRDLQSRSLQPVPMDRFRPNIVVSGLAPFAEHELQRLEGPGWILSLQRLNPAPTGRQMPAFGQNAALRRGTGSHLRVGDPLTT